jgi:hypothetical protein
MDKAMVLQNDTEFWEHQKDGIALFISPEMARVYCLPLRFRDL